MSTIYTDVSYPAIDSQGLTYLRGDGARVTVRIEPPPGSPVTHNTRSLFAPGGPEIVHVTGTPLPTVGRLEGRGPVRRAAQAPAGVVPRLVETVSTSGDVFDHPILGGRLTLCVLLYGDYHDLHRRCLETLVTTTPASRLDIRVGSNELCQASLDLISRLQANGRISKHYQHAENARKYPVMREMFHDLEHPITTAYTIWFDDDTVCDRDPGWLTNLAQTIVANHGAGYRYYGPEYIWKLSRQQVQWIKESTWYQGRAFCNAHKQEVPNGDKVFFATGSCWAVETAMIRRASLPDVRLSHNGGDWACGEALRQHGAKLKRWNQKKQIVNWSSVPRRGLNTPPLSR